MLAVRPPLLFAPPAGVREDTDRFVLLAFRGFERRERVGVTSEPTEPVRRTKRALQRAGTAQATLTYVWNNELLDVQLKEN